MTILVASVSAGAQDYVYDDLLGPDSLQWMLQNNAPVTGTYRFDGPVVEVVGTNIISKLGKPITKGKLKKTLNDFFKKVKLNDKSLSLRLDGQGNFALVKGDTKLVKGEYVYHPADEELTLNWHGFKMKAKVKKKGKRLEIAMLCDHWLSTLEKLNKILHIEALETLVDLSKNYSGVTLGLALKKK